MVSEEVQAKLDQANRAAREVYGASGFNSLARSLYACTVAICEALSELKKTP